ncbi:MAG: glycosyl hydrolase 53 family protein [Saprospiraceae bacterium]
MTKAIIIFFILLSNGVLAQSFFFGADMSYVNEMEDCGVSYYENENPEDLYSIFKNHGCNLVRLRLWHTPSWYDNLNSGKRYSDLNDVKIAIARARQYDIDVLLDFHLSDNWADPSSQLVPDAWLSVVNDIDLLKDSLYNYIFNTLDHLNDQGLLPELIQIGNETNKGILLSPQDNANWILDWNRNATLFNYAIKAVNDFEHETGKDIRTVIHLAGPEDAEWLMDDFVSNQVTDFDIIGLSYYWAWHKPTTISETGQIIRTLKTLYPDKEVLIVETGYIWTTEWNDSAANIISETHPDYYPASPENQRDWLIDLTQEVIESGGLGVTYWEPCWVSSTCFTQWGQGSHQEHATFFDFDNNLLAPGGIEWMDYTYDFSTSTESVPDFKQGQVQILSNSVSGDVRIKQDDINPKSINVFVTDTTGKVWLNNSFDSMDVNFNLGDIPLGIYIITVQQGNSILKSKKVRYSRK